MNSSPLRNGLRSVATTFEELESRNLLSVSASSSSVRIDIVGVSPDERIPLSAAYGTAADQQYVEIMNESSFKARFAMEVNGNISKNISHLVQQIRAAQFPDDQQLPDYERAYRYMLRFHQHDFPLTGRTWSHEPSLYLNALSAGLCDDSASVLAGIWHEMGYDARVWLLDGHVVSEVYTGQRWEMYDADLRVVYYNDQGQVAGVEELAANPSIIRHPYGPTSDDPYLYSARMASFYTSVNRICAACNEYTSERDLIFEIPAGGVLSWGQTYGTKTLPTVHLDAATKFGQLKVTIPAGSSGVLDIPLPIYDIEGATTDSVTVTRKEGHAQVLALGASDPFEFFNRDVQKGNRVQPIEFENNGQRIEVIYFFNERFAEVLARNLVEIVHATENPAALCVSIRTNLKSTEQDSNVAAKSVGAPVSSFDDSVDRPMADSIAAAVVSLQMAVASDDDDA